MVRVWVGGGEMGRDDDVMAMPALLLITTGGRLPSLSGALTQQTSREDGKSSKQKRS